MSREIWWRISFWTFGKKYVYLSIITSHISSFMPYYSLFWMRSPYLDLRWRSCSTGTIPELLITSIVRHKNKNRWVGDPLWRSCSLFLCRTIDVISSSSIVPVLRDLHWRSRYGDTRYGESFGLVKYPYTNQFTWSPQGIPHSPVLVILC